MTIENTNMGEQPIFSCKAHVFHIDPKTKRSWIPASTSAVSVSFFYDSTRQLYRIISVEGTKAVINSTITPNMMFTKTSQKFGQWSDMRANTVYGLGFSTEAELNMFIEKFQEVKEATRSGKANGTAGGPMPNSGPVGPPMASTAPPGAPPSVVTCGPPSATASPLTTRAKLQNDGQNDINSISTGLENASVGANERNSISSSDPNASSSQSLLKSSIIAHQRSHSVSGAQPSSESPKHKCDINVSGNKIVGNNQQDSQGQLKYENDRLKLALAQSSANAKKWEIELNSLKTTNTRLTSALQESTANVEEWKKQLQTYKEENNRMKNRIMEMENGGERDLDETSHEIANLRGRIDNLSDELESRDSIVEDLRVQLQRARTEEFKERLQQMSDEKDHLHMETQHLQSQLDVALATQESQRGVVESVNLQLGERIKDLLALHHELNHLLTT